MNENAEKNGSFTTKPADGDLEQRFKDAADVLMHARFSLYNKLDCEASKGLEMVTSHYVATVFNGIIADIKGNDKIKKIAIEQLNRINADLISMIQK